MRMVARLLKPGDDIRDAIEKAVKEENISAGTVISCVGALRKAHLRMPGTKRDNQDIKDLEGPFEIISLNGNVGHGRTHLHMSISDKNGNVYGGHLKTGGNIVEVTCELVIAVEDSLRFTEKYDDSVGWDNLVIEERK